MRLPVLGDTVSLVVEALLHRHCPLPPTPRRGPALNLVDDEGIG